VPLVARGQLIGVATFIRSEQRAFPATELCVLRDVGRALSVAAANALANEEIRRLREQLEAENISLRAQLGQAPWFEEILAHSAALKRVLETVEQVATTDATVLITGETGTGKELVARAVHRRSARARGPFIKVNCAAIPDTLLASELFGHERGAFTGALERRKGRFEQAHGGTLFLDEIGELPQEMQVLLLRVLQEKEFERLGGTNTLQVDVRLVTATNRDLAEEVRVGRFRSDLYYRLNVFPVHVPALRERPEDIPPLVAHFAEKYGARFGRTISRIERNTLDVLQAHDWPGNVRRRFMHRAEKLPERPARQKDWGFLPRPWNFASRSWESTSFVIADGRDFSVAETGPDAPAELVTANRAQPKRPVSPQIVRKPTYACWNQNDLVRIPTRVRHRAPGSRSRGCQGRQYFMTAE
jgi:formate hydrogenlyase transcriptional activator